MGSQVVASGIWAFRKFLKSFKLTADLSTCRIPDRESPDLKPIFCKLERLDREVPNWRMPSDVTH
jgi:hypothetical protein